MRASASRSTFGHRLLAGAAVTALLTGGLAALVAAGPAGADSSAASGHDGPGTANGSAAPPALGSDDGGDQVVLYVVHTATASASDTTCQSAAYSSVQSAVDAAPPGAVVYLCGTTPFVGAVAIDKPVTLTGDRGASIAAGDSASTTGLAPTTFFSSKGLVTPHAVVTVVPATTTPSTTPSVTPSPTPTSQGGQGAPRPHEDTRVQPSDTTASSEHVQIAGLTLKGPFDASGCGYTDYGVLAVGGNVVLRADTITTVRASTTGLLGCQTGVAVEVGARFWQATAGASGTGGSAASGSTYEPVDFSARAAVLGTTVSAYQKNGITADGPGTTLMVAGSAVTGSGPTSHIAQNGVQISRGATGMVRDTAISGNESTVVAPTAVSTGVLVYGGCATNGVATPLSTGVHVVRDRLTNNDVGIDFVNLDAACTGPATARTADQAVADVVTKTDGDTNKADYNGYTSYQAGIADAGTGDQFLRIAITGTVTPSTGKDAAFGPETTSGGPYLVPLTLVTARGAQVHDVVYDGRMLPGARGDGGGQGDAGGAQGGDGAQGGGTQPGDGGQHGALDPVPGVHGSVVRG